MANNSTYWVIFELLWRDYFRFVCQKFGDRVFYKSGILNKDIHWSQDKAKFRAWAEGNTGVPFVDANMRELKMVSTGGRWQSFYGTSFAIVPYKSNCAGYTELAILSMFRLGSCPTEAARTWPASW